MPLKTKKKVGETGPALPANTLPGTAQEEISNAIGLVTAANMFGRLGTISGLEDIYGWRVDRQNAPGDMINISVQRNDVGAPSTVASVFVPTKYLLAPPTVGAKDSVKQGYKARQRELERAVRRGLEDSFGSYEAPKNPPNVNARIIYRYEVSGEFSS